jgi:hypothetical protein
MIAAYIGQDRLWHGRRQIHVARFMLPDTNTQPLFPNIQPLF